MYPLAFDQYAIVSPLFAPMNYHAIVDAILAQDVPATIYVDDPACPQAAFTWTGRRYLLAGSAQNREFNRAIAGFFFETVFPRSREAGPQVLALYYSSDEWESEIEEILGDRRPNRIERQYYRFEAFPKRDEPSLPAGFKLASVDRALLADQRLENREELMQEMCSERASVEEFLARSFGLCALHGQELAGWCLSEYNTGERCEIGIETGELYRRQGLATAMTVAFVREAHRRGYRHIGWDCFADNLPSVNTARKAGFVHVADYPAFLVRY